MKKPAAAGSKTEHDLPEGWTSRLVKRGSGAKKGVADKCLVYALESEQAQSFACAGNRAPCSGTSSA